jgi:1-acyl-sn-glycerol-3-phosphate acyltransferase
VRRLIRGSSALVIGFTITTCVGLFGCITALPCGLIAHLFSRKNPVRLLIPFWSYLVDELCVKKILGARIMVGGEALTGGGIVPAKEDEIVICVANHPSTLLIPSFTRFVTEYICKDVVAIGKREHLRNPVTGWFMKLSGTGILVDRDNNDSTGAVIKVDLKRLVRTPLAIIIFPDMRRPSLSRVVADREKFASKIPDINDWLHYTMMPRSGALYSLLQELKGRKLRFFSITTACSVDDSSILNILDIVGSHIVIEPQRFDHCALIQSREALNHLLNERWRKINNNIGRWKANRNSSVSSASKEEKC